MNINRLMACLPLPVLRRRSVSALLCLAWHGRWQAVAAGLVVYLVLSLERRVRSRYKQQLPPAVAAMQQHVYQLPLGLALAEGGLLVYCCAAVTWLAAGAWNGLALRRGA